MQEEMLKVLLVDDEPYILKGMSVIIDWEQEGYEIVEMKNSGTQAVEVLKEQEIDLVITDIKMPQMSGLELASKLRDEKLSDADVVILSGYHDFAYARQAFKSECVDYLLKPINREELLEVLHKVKKRKLKNKALETADRRAQGTAGEMLGGRMQSGPEKNAEYSVGENTEEVSQLQGYQVQGVLGQVERYLRENYRENLTLKELGKKYYINAAYLGQIFKKQYGESFKEYLNHIRIEKAQEMLLRTDKKIYEIAEEIGYKDLDYFVNKFIAMMGCTPTKYRKQNRK